MLKISHVVNANDGRRSLGTFTKRKRRSVNKPKLGLQSSTSHTKDLEHGSLPTRLPCLLVTAWQNTPNFAGFRLPWKIYRQDLAEFCLPGVED